MLVGMSPPPRKPVVVRRPEPPHGDGPSGLSSRPGLTKDEVRALLAVTSASRPPWGRVARRAGLGLLPTIVLSVVLDGALGWWGTPALFVVLAVFAAWPLFQQRRDGWT